MQSLRRFNLKAALIALFGAAALASGAAAQPPAPAPQTAAPALTAEDVGAWLDGFVPYALRQGDVAGAVVVVVKDDKVLFEKGYGYANVAARRPVDPETTLFRPGSVSKLFTWTAVMQLVQAGKLDLDADVNRYLDFTIPPRDGKPVTLRELMTHTAGFEDRDKNLGGYSAAALIPLADFERGHLPARIFPPGELPAYSNYGAGLAGLIVQRVSGEPFETYVERHIFAPLGMTHSSFRQPLPPQLRAEMSSGYERGSSPAGRFAFINPAPAGGLSASGGDISRFMIAQLNDGGYGSAQILSPATTRQMHATVFRITPQIPGMSLGFFEAERNGHRALGHSGDVDAFHSDLELLPDDHIGLFVSLNSSGAGPADEAIRAQLFRGFVDRYFPAPIPDMPRWKTAIADGRLVAGPYELSRRGQTTLLAVERLIIQASVRADAKGDLTIPILDSLTGAPPRTWREIGPMLWQEVGGKSRIAAVVNEGQVTALTTDDFPAIAVLQPVPPGLRMSWLGPALAAAIAVLALTVALWPISALVRRHYRAALPLSGRAAMLYRLVRLTALVELAFLGLWVTTLATIANAPEKANSDLDPWLRSLQGLGLVGLIGAAVALLNLILVLADAKRGWWAKLSNLVIVLALGVVTWAAFAINAFAPSLNY
ncbi:MAG TPA: serine hydrolase domain-containing protein [Caulobacteraceae bacterium]|nr:serine hydrolase domain-containing protein [Caulobacteraceae bacterium]